MSKVASVVILGGGIHGAGVLHDLTSRGFRDVYLVEKKSLGSGASSKSTKMIHGGLRYLERPSQIKMVYECLQERKLLLSLAPQLVKPIQLLLPLYGGGFLQDLKIKIGLSLYDLLARDSLIEPHRLLSFEQALEEVPIIKNMSKLGKFYSYWDAQTDDKLLVEKVAASGKNLGGCVLEGVEALSLRDKGKHWDVLVGGKDHPQRTMSARYIVNCLGPSSNDFLVKNGFKPSYQGKKSKGTHIILKSFGLSSGLLLRAIDGRVFFILPWKGKTLVGTTERPFDELSPYVEAEENEIAYLLESCNQALGLSLKKGDVESSFSGLRWLALEKGKSLTKTSRESILGKIENKRGFILTVYGGKLTSYRSLCEKIGDDLTNHYGCAWKTRTHLRESWV